MIRLGVCVSGGADSLKIAYRNRRFVRGQRTSGRCAAGREDKEGADAEGESNESVACQLRSLELLTVIHKRATLFLL